MSKRIMLVDDDRTLTALLKTLLELDGFAVSVVSQGARVLDQVKSQTPDAVVMDVHLAESDGLAVLRALRAQPAFQLLPVIMVSGMDVEDSCSQAGASGFLLKPYPPEQLTQALQKVLA